MRSTTPKVRPHDESTPSKPKGSLLEGPAVWLGNLSDYSAGRLTGQWKALSEFESADDLREAIDDFLAKSGGEEWFFADTSGLPKGISENPDLDRLWEIYEAVEEHGLSVVEGFSGCFGLEAVTVDAVAEAYQGAHDSVEAYAEALAEDTGMFDGVPEVLKTYFDTEAYARDLILGGDIYSAPGEAGQVHIFLANP